MTAMALVDWLASSHHGQGIMSAALRTIMTEWAIPKMNVRDMRVEVVERAIGLGAIWEAGGRQ